MEAHATFPLSVLVSDQQRIADCIPFAFLIPVPVPPPPGGPGPLLRAAVPLRARPSGDPQLRGPRAGTSPDGNPPEREPGSVRTGAPKPFLEVSVPVDRAAGACLQGRRRRRRLPAGPAGRELPAERRAAARRGGGGGGVGRIPRNLPSPYVTRWQQDAERDGYQPSHPPPDPPPRLFNLNGTAILMVTPPPTPSTRHGHPGGGPGPHSPSCFPLTLPSPRTEPGVGCFRDHVFGLRGGLVGRYVPFWQARQNTLF